ncbi:RNA-directed DNA polymerase from mobile element jockey [Exaiptasia diaphana]|nr:RNA-directed DNA polymerase from mobile element jockey [Exaiptasia diaphana]
MNVNTCLMHFTKVSPHTLLKIINHIASKSCELDPIPAKVLKMSIDCLLPVITKVVHLSGDRLETVFGIGGSALKWFQSYLENRTFFVSVEGGKSSLCSFDCGVPQGSVLGPILFLLYTSPIVDIILSHGLDFHLYADDTQLYISFSDSSCDEVAIAKLKVEACTSEIDKWMHANKLKLNSDKCTECMFMYVTKTVAVD